ncbi:MAG: LysR family transcriptional regulator [Lachnospiraceae bacterium]|nr:LysR family transcriptional regulator [Lachnospiraceae bacterium]
MISNIEYYRTFMYVAKFHSFTQAADHLCVSQSAVSQSVKKLEEELGHKLLIRNAREFKLTAEGELMFSYVQRAIQEFYTGENMLNRLSMAQAGELKVGATETVIRVFLPEKLREFKQKFPNIKITFLGATIEDLRTYLYDGAIEMAFLVTPFVHENIYEITQIAHIQDIPVVSADYPIDREKEYTLAELSRLPLICVSGDNHVRQMLDGYFAHENVFLSPDYTVRNMGTVQTLVERGLGIAFLPEDIIREQLENETLIRLKTKSLPPMRSIYLAVAPSRPISPIARKFISMFT